MAQINVPGERWEVEFLSDGTVDVEVFRSNGDIHDERMIDTLIALHSSSAPDPSGTPNNNGVLTQ